MKAEFYRSSRLRRKAKDKRQKVKIKELFFARSASSILPFAF